MRGRSIAPRQTLYSNLQMRRALALVVLGVLASGPFLKWTCVDACAPGSQPPSTKAECHGSAASELVLSSRHDCVNHAPSVGPGVVTRIESHAPTAVIPRSAPVDVTVVRRPVGELLTSPTGAVPPLLSSNIPLRI